MFDWTSGLPIIPGSSLKGASLRVAEYIVKNEITIEGLSLEKGEKESIFGSKDKSGNIIFCPAHPCADDNKPFLDLDVMTPHYQPFYQKNENNPPADWYSPVPLFFLTVPRGIKYCFRLAEKNI